MPPTNDHKVVPKNSIQRISKLVIIFPHQQENLKQRGLLKNER